MKPEDDVERAVDIRRSLIGKEAYALRSRTIELTFADAKEKRACNILIIYQGRNQAPNWARLIFAAMNLKMIAMWNQESFIILFLQAYN